MREDTCMMVTCPHGRMSYYDNTEPNKCKYSPRLIACIHTVHLSRHLRGTFKYTFTTFEILREHAMSAKHWLEKDELKKHTIQSYLDSPAIMVFLPVTHYTFVIVKSLLFRCTNKILTKRIARLRKTNIYIMVIHQIFPQTPLQAPICLVKLWAGAGRWRLV